RRLLFYNSIMQSGKNLEIQFLAYGWGLGLTLKLNGFQVFGISVLLYAAQVILSGLWLSKFNYGPFEWVWRCVTYWKILSIEA
ncbi:MAG: DUF418 domain-containing protein, partial [Actinobacteria bacterium]|nr:DUF418 domain-containing protein [Actinomycetota bacterium]